jgi:hypothetical protein
VNSSDSISVIARSLGYESESAFSTAFKRVTGRSPRQYSHGRNGASPSQGEEEAALHPNRVEPEGVIGSARFKKISAVERIKYSPGMKGQTAVSRLKNPTPEEKRKAIIQAYRGKA